MATNKDWFPKTRDEQLSMGFIWNTALVNQSTTWNIPTNVQAAFSPLVSAAESTLSIAKDESSRTPVATAQCREAFKALEEKMRDIKKRYFYVPPLTEADLISLGLKPHDNIPTPSGTPTAQVTVETFLSGRHELGIKIIYVTGTVTDPANKGYRIWYTVVAPSVTPPTNPKELHESFYTKRKKDVIEFDFDDSGKTAWFAVQIENEGKKGPWGPMVQALIP
ncbi:hypothetical protein LQZ19_07575 [Treponema primitia]|uniref:hypothetical protein n=1 Tax=Treponema primitia TaxID=88058 RepID=UPI00397EB521